MLLARPNAFCACLFVYLQFQVPLAGQGFLAGGKAPRMFGTDMAVLEAGEPRQDLPCKLEETKPILGFDLKFHAGFEVRRWGHRLGRKQLWPGHGAFIRAT